MNAHTPSTPISRTVAVPARRRRLRGATLSAALLAGLCGLAPALRSQPTEPTGDPVEPAADARPRLCFLAGALESEDVDAGQLSDLLLALFDDRLAAAGLELTPLPAGSELAPGAIAQEAGCTYLLRVDFVHRRGSNGVWRQAAREALGGAIGYVPVGGGLGGALLGSMATRGALAAADYVLATRAKDRLQLGYRLTALSKSTPLVDRSETAKAKHDGEDVLSPLVARAAAEVAARLAATESAS